MLEQLWRIGLLGGSYLLGSLSSAVLVCQVLRLPDPREHGSHNPGTTNVLRLGGKWPALCTLLGDLAKGALPVMVLQLLALPTISGSELLLAAFLGHLYPVWFKFQGGKGVATLLGGGLALDLRLGLSFLFIWLSIAGITLYSSLAALLAAISMPALASYWLFSTRDILLLSMMALFLIWRHRSNIQRLLQGQEARLGTKKP